MLRELLIVPRLIKLRLDGTFPLLPSFSLPYYTLSYPAATFRMACDAIDADAEQLRECALVDAGGLRRARLLEDVLDLLVGERVAQLLHHLLQLLGRHDAVVVRVCVPRARGGNCLLRWECFFDASRFVSTCVV